MMKKLIAPFFLLFLNLPAYAQCNSTEEVNNMATACRKEIEKNYMPTKEQEKWMTEIYTTVIEPSIKTTKGLRGTWHPEGNYKVTPEGYTNSRINIYLNPMGCKDHKIYNKDEAGLILGFNLNGFNGAINVCTAEGDTIIKNKIEKLYLNDKLNGSQIYHLHKQTLSDKYANFAFYSMTNDAKYFVITRPGIPLFIPVTIRQALEINRNKQIRRIALTKQTLQLPDFKPETRSDYEKRMAKDFATYRSTFPDPEKFISDMINQLEEQKKSSLKGQQEMVVIQAKFLDILSDYLKTAPGKDLDKPAYNSSLPGMSFDNKSELIEIIANDNPDAGALVILNSAYFNNNVSKAAPQFISVELRIQDSFPVTLKAFKTFEENLDFNKIRQFLNN